MEKVLKEQQQQHLDVERSWERDRDRELLRESSREREREFSAKGICSNGNSTSPGCVESQQQQGTSVRSQEQHSPTPVRMPQSPEVGVPTTPGKSSGASTPAVSQSPQVMVSPSASLHHMQQLLQQHVLTPTQLQTLMKQHSMYLQQSQHQHQVSRSAHQSLHTNMSAGYLQQHHLAEIGKKQLEQTMQQLQEQIQLNLIQQTHILQSNDKKKASGSLQQLALQQQQLIQQLQIMQRQYVVHQGMGIQPIILAQAQVQAQVQAQAQAQAQGAGRKNLKYESPATNCAQDPTGISFQCICHSIHLIIILYFGIFLSLYLTNTQLLLAMKRLVRNRRSNYVTCSM